MKNQFSYKDIRFIIFGRISYTDYFIKALADNNFSIPIVIVSPDEEYVRDERLLETYGLRSNVEQLEKEGLCQLYKIKNVNDGFVENLIKKENRNFAISINCRSIIKKKIIKLFEGLFFNVHSSYLPFGRGGAPQSWKILLGDNYASATIHAIAEEVDAGPIVVQKKKLIKDKFPEPIDYIFAEKEICEELIDKLMKILKESKKLTFAAQDHNSSFYLSRLYTKVNGAIDWDWAINYVEKFIRAFSAPYDGAFTYYDGKKINILKSEIDKNSPGLFHPFCNGRILTILDNGCCRVVAGGECLIINKIAYNGVEMTPGKLLKVGKILNTPFKDLEIAKTTIPVTRDMD